MRVSELSICMVLEVWSCDMRLAGTLCDALGRALNDGGRASQLCCTCL